MAHNGKRMNQIVMATEQKMVERKQLLSCRVLTECFIESLLYMHSNVFLHEYSSQSFKNL